MDSLINIIIVIIVIASVVFRVKKAAKLIAKNRPAGNQPANTAGDQAQYPSGQSVIDAASRTIIAPTQFLPAFPQAGFNGKDLNKIITVYGAGAAIGTEEVSILLNVSLEQAQNYLDQLASQGKAEMVTSVSGKTRYKLL